jgi:hypothetical protein
VALVRFRTRAEKAPAGKEEESVRWIVVKRTEHRVVWRIKNSTTKCGITGVVVFISNEN